MNEVATRTPDVIAVEIRSIDSHARSVLLISCLEIGQRLVEAKDLLPHGEWGDWLKGAVNYSQSTANNLMQLYREYGDGKFTTLGNLSYTKAIALLGVPEEEREDFAKTNDIENKSAREIQRLIKERDNISAERDTLKKENTALQSALKDEKKQAKANVKRLTAMLVEAKENGSSDTKVQELEQELQAANEQVKKLTDQLNEPITIEAAVVDKVPAEIEQELAELRQKTQELEAQNKQQDSPAIHKYGVYFEALVSGFRNLLGSLAEVHETNPELHEKYRGAVIALIGKMSDKL
ncbi:Chromosome partition protein Smc [Sporomusa ovata DSM 2662]|uniref:Protein export cytoplasm protein SecA ATPase RNA helicase (TC 3.A.5.1.1) n=1 Tax=Sporomusa ovata TaxID=2378 RepID=A0A0U1KVG2_9FIRM|nr:DUF3102 domain-containing protein [Sporomusa ovata]EQB29320.1 hypothetical protein SOV_1c10530 [Sporomusa ovata DSM 2662]CQR71361.1 Protein export cytoplasm protein SecA ATPase RNA helicase (TC 3.A.5.1.1) [Sporomusa ovata]